jgi:diaminopimelate decarboxylase
MNTKRFLWRLRVNKPQHAPQTSFDVSESGELLIGGHPLRQLAARAGGTPFYVYDRSVMSRTVYRLRDAFPERLHLHYAIKANSMPAVVHHMAGITDGLDVASGLELLTALDTGIPARHISFAGPGKTEPELTQAVASGVIINVESETELSRIIAISEQLNLTANIALRVNPDFELKSSGMKMGGGAKPFGIDADRIPALVKSIVQHPHLSFEGFHIFSGSQNLKPEAIIEAQNNTFELAYRLVEGFESELTWLNIGGGLGIPYFPGESELDLTEIAENLSLRLEEAHKRLPNAEFVMELGRYLVGQAGLYVCEVTDVKSSRDEPFAITNGGLHHHLSASGNFGQVIRKNYPVSVAGKINESPAEKPITVVGPLCTPLDIIADKMALPKIQIGDLIAVHQSGAYGFTASPRDFLSHPHPKQILV